MINTGEQEAYILVDRFIETGMPFAMYRIDVYKRQIPFRTLLPRSGPLFYR